MQSFISSHTSKREEDEQRKRHTQFGQIRNSLTIRWTAGHEGIEGIGAAEGLTSEKRLLPVLLGKPLMINPAAVKRADHKKKKKSWATEWNSSERGQRTARLDKSTPSKKFLKAINNSELSRQAASRIAQFRLSHAPRRSTSTLSGSKEWTVLDARHAAQTRKQ